MSPADITAISGVVVAFLSSIIVPWLLRRRSEREHLDQTDVVSWTSLTQALQSERDKLQQRNAMIDAEHQQRILRMTEEHRREMHEITTQLQAARARITTLEQEVAELYTRLSRRGGLDPQ